MLEVTNKSIEAMQDCLKALNTAQQVTLQITDHNFAHALRLIDELQGNLLPRIEQYSVAEKIKRLMPTQIAAIRNYAVEEMKSWLGIVRSKVALIGEMSFAMAQKRIEEWQSLHKDLSTPITSHSGLFQSEGEAAAAAYADLIEMEREDASAILKHESVCIDFVPLLKALHFFELMNKRSEFQNLFAEYRRAQAKVIFEMSVNLRDPEAKSFAAFLHTVCGFFIVEYFLVQHPQAFYSPVHVESLWESVVNTINGYVLDSLNVGLGDEAVFMKIKWLQVFFLHSMEIYSIFPLNSMIDTLVSLFYRFVDLSKVELAHKIHVAASKSNLSPMPISPTYSIAKMKKLLPFFGRDLRADQYEEDFPFSSFIPDLMTIIMDFLNNFYIFLEGIPQQSTELDLIARKSCDWILHEAAEALTARCQEANVDVTVQVICDFECMKQMAEDVSELLASKKSQSQGTL